MDCQSHLVGTRLQVKLAFESAVYGGFVAVVIEVDSLHRSLFLASDDSKSFTSFLWARLDISLDALNFLPSVHCL